jgi:thiamine biosynthesis lipoprotein
MAGTVPPRLQPIYRTSALGTRAEVLVTDPDALVAAARILHNELERIDGLASRFRSDSEISRLHRANGVPTVVSEGLLEAILVATRVAAATEGAVDPTVGAAMCRVGYDRDFSQIAAGLPGQLPNARAVPGWRAVEIDTANRSVRLPRDMRLDLGATAKALAADHIAEAAHRECGCGVLVSLGGDVATAGAPREGFHIGMGEACGIPDGNQTVAIFSGGLATSGIWVRQWRLGRDTVHHIIDPSTGLPVSPVWRTVTVCAASCVDANAASTAAMVKGAEAIGWLESHFLPARLVAMDGSVATVGDWPDDPGSTGEPRGTNR